PAVVFDRRGMRGNAERADDLLHLCGRQQRIKSVNRCGNTTWKQNLTGFGSLPYVVNLRAVPALVVARGKLCYSGFFHQGFGQVRAHSSFVVTSRGCWRTKPRPSLASVPTTRS